MKVEVKETTEFKPIVLNITIESKEELISLYTRVNLSGNSIFLKESNRFKPLNTAVEDLDVMHNKISDILLSL